MNTVADRCEILFEDLLLNEIPEKKVMSIKLSTLLGMLSVDKMSRYNR